MPEPLPYSINSPFYSLMKNWPCQTNITPNMVTYTGIVFSIGALYTLVSQPCNWQWFACLVFIRTLLDAMDGSIARKCGTTSNFGAQLDRYHDHIFATCVMTIGAYRAYVNRSAYTLPVLAIVMIVVLSSILESSTNGTWASNDLVFKPVLYTSVAYLSSRCQGK